MEASKVGTEIGGKTMAGALMFVVLAVVAVYLGNWAYKKYGTA